MDQGIHLSDEALAEQEELEFGMSGLGTRSGCRIGYGSGRPHLSGAWDHFEASRTPREFLGVGERGQGVGGVILVLGEDEEGDEEEADLSASGATNPDLRQVMFEQMAKRF